MNADANERSRTADPPSGDVFPAEPEPEAGRGWGDNCVPAFIFLFCAVVTALSLTFEEALPLIVGESMQPRVFPIFLMALIAVLNIVLILQVLRSPLSRRDWEPSVTWSSVALMGLFWFITEFVDMMAALVVVMFLLCLAWGERRIWVAALLAVGTTTIIFFSFDLVLEVRFPRGLLTDRYYG